MFYLVYFISFILHAHIINGGFLRFNNPEHMTAPLDLDDLDPGSYDDLFKFNPGLQSHDEQISYGGDPNKPFAWDAPEIDYQYVELVTDPPPKPSTEKADEEKPSILFLAKRPVPSDSQNPYALYNQYNQSRNPNSIYKKYQSAALENLAKALAKPELKDFSAADTRRAQDKLKKSYKIWTPKVNRTVPWNSTFSGNSDDSHTYFLAGTFVVSCFRCGELNYGKWWRPSVQNRTINGRVIPNDTICSEAFSDDWRHLTKARYLRTKCFNNTGQQQGHYVIGDDNLYFYHECVARQRYTFSRNHTHDRGNPMDCFGPYTGKCFKRFLDVGRTYTERGCASWPPHQSNSFASHRFTKMEYLLFHKDRGCVSSPLASLTPYARSISLYVRYHVCVCTGNYCNSALQACVATVPFLLFAVFILVY